MLTRNNDSSMRRCVPLARDGVIEADMRVNYTFGLVLGEAEFQQEQHYFLSKDYLHNRALHGYGTVSGLDVTLDDELRVTVGEGLGVDQFGRTFAVRDPQCADLIAWYSRQAEDAFDHQDSDVRTVYVVAKYDECEDALVSIAGQPCSTGAENQAASRIRASVKIELRTRRPAMPSWTALQLMADLLYDVSIIPNLDPDLSDEAAILELLDLLDRPAQMLIRYDELTQLGEDDETVFQPLRLPADDLPSTLDRIFTYWITEVRPTLAPNLIQPTAEDEDAILLATIRFRDTSSDDVVSLQVSEDSPDDTGRPYLLHTQAIQQLLALGSSQEDMSRDFATLNVVNQRLVTVWIHHPDALVLPDSLGEGLQLLVNETEYNGTVQPVPDVSNVFNINTTRDIPNAARVTLRFGLNAIELAAVEDDSEEEPAPAEPADPERPDVDGVIVRPIRPVLTTRPSIRDNEISRFVNRSDVVDLSNFTIEERTTISGRLEMVRERATVDAGSSLLAQLHAQYFDYVGRDGDFILVHAFADNVFHSGEFATVQTLVGDVISLRLWVHQDADTSVTFNDGAINLARLTANGIEEIDTAVTDEGGNVFRILPRTALNDGDVLRLNINVRAVNIRGLLLGTRINNEQLHYDGYDGQDTLTLYHIVDANTGTGTGGGDGLGRSEVVQIVDERIETLRTMDFVTITPGLLRAPRGQGRIGYELWFHVDLVAELLENGVEQDSLQEVMRVYLELENGSIAPTQLALQAIRQNVVLVAIEDARIDITPETAMYARFAFALDQPIINGQVSLRDYMRENNLRFVGNFGESEELGESLILYARLPVSLFEGVLNNG